MQAIGYSLTWKTRCFIDPTCRSPVFAHTNGYGDFVLFDSLGWPWPVHECYLTRLELTNENARIDIFRSRDIPLDGPLRREWHTVRPVEPDLGGPRNRFDLLGTVTNIERSFIGRSKEFRGLSRMAEEEMHRVLGGRRGLVTIVTGEGEEFTAFLDLEKMQIGFGDIVTARVKAVRLLNTSAFLVTDAHVFASGVRRRPRKTAAACPSPTHPGTG